MRLALVIDGLGPGGAQRVLTTMANHWATRGSTVTLITLQGETTPSFPLDAAVSQVRLGTIRSDRGRWSSRLWGKTRHVTTLRKAIVAAHPDAVISFIDRVNVLTLLATRGLGVPVVVSERTEPAAYPVGWLWERLRAWVYPAAAALVAQSAAALHYFPPVAGRADRVIPNPVIRVDPPVERSRQESSNRVLAIGRLGREKGFDRLLSAFAPWASRFPEWELEIWGEGPERQALERQRSDLRLEQRVRLPGFARDPMDLMRSSAIFVLSSRFEGFPNALCEAMASGLAVISYDCPSGPREIVRHEIDGLLVPLEGGVDALSAALGRLMESPVERRRLGARATEVIERFDVARVLGLWDELLADLLHGRISD